MSLRPEFTENDLTRLIFSIIDFLREQFNTRSDLLPEDRDCLEIAMQCLEMAYRLDINGYVQSSFSRPLLDIFYQVTNPVSVRDRIHANAHKDTGNELMMYDLYENAEAEYTAAIELDRWNSIYYCNRAGARIAQRNYFAAIADCRQALMLNPDYAKACSRMGQAYTSLNRNREAARCFGQALQLEPTNERYRNNLSVAASLLSPMEALGIFSDLLRALFRSGPPTAPGSSLSLRVQPPLLIFTEEITPTADTSQRNTQSTPNLDETTRIERNVPGSSSHGVEVPTSFAATNLPSTRNSTVHVDPASSSENNDNGNVENSKQVGSVNISNISTDTSNTQHAVDLTSLPTVEESLGMKKCPPKLEIDEGSNKLSSPESDKSLSADKSNIENTDSKRTTNFVSDSVNREWNKIKEDGKKSIILKSSDTELPSTEKNADNNSGIIGADAETMNETEESEAKMPCPKKSDKN